VLSCWTSPTGRWDHLAPKPVGSQAQKCQGRRRKEGLPPHQSWRRGRRRRRSASELILYMKQLLIHLSGGVLGRGSGQPRCGWLALAGRLTCRSCAELEPALRALAGWLWAGRRGWAREVDSRGKLLLARIPREGKVSSQSPGRFPAVVREGFSSWRVKNGALRSIAVVAEGAAASRCGCT